MRLSLHPLISYNLVISLVISNTPLTPRTEHLKHEESNNGWHDRLYCHLKKVKSKSNSASKIAYKVTKPLKIMRLQVAKYLIFIINIKETTNFNQLIS